MPNLNGKIVVVDDDPAMCRLLADVLGDEGHTVKVATSGPQALATLSEQVDLVITDMRLPEMQGLELMHRIKRERPEVGVIVITAFGTIESAIEAMKLGAYDYLPKPFKIGHVALVVQKALQDGALRREVAQLRQVIGKEYQFGNIIGKSAAMQESFDLIKRIADTTTNVLITGETGTGKELIAKAIHFNSPCKSGPFVPVNSAAIPENLLESELFGHVRGAFTDAKLDKAGLFEKADGGSLLLDEVSEPPMSLQAKLLRVIQEKELRRVGANESTKIDVRVIAASNLDLEQEVSQHRFRSDLFYRLNVIHIHLPPLRDRRDDIVLLAEHFLQKYRQQTRKSVTAISDAALSLLVRYPWPGNVREMENVVERAVILARGDQITPEDLPPSVTGQQDDFVILEKALEQTLPLAALEREYMLRILEKTGGNKQRTAQILGIDRRTLYRKLAAADVPANEDPPVLKDNTP